jgi:hypothetical protein
MELKDFEVTGIEVVELNDSMDMPEGSASQKYVPITCCCSCCF